MRGDGLRDTKHLHSKQRHVTVGREGRVGSNFYALRESQSPRKTLPNPQLVNKKRSGALRCPSPA
jgi:hypothetical protein